MPTAGSDHQADALGARVDISSLVLPTAQHAQETAQDAHQEQTAQPAQTTSPSPTEAAPQPRDQLSSQDWPSSQPSYIISSESSDYMRLDKYIFS